MKMHDSHLRAAAIVRDAGGQLVGRTRLQKVAYLMQLAGFGDEFQFEYRHYGPFSEDLASAVEIAAGLGLLDEEERRTDWGGWYSIYKSTSAVKGTGNLDRARFLSEAVKIGPIELELAATAAFIYAEEGVGRIKKGDPWKETVSRKPEKAASGRLDRAKAAYHRLLNLKTPHALPNIA